MRFIPFRLRRGRTRQLGTALVSQFFLIAPEATENALEAGPAVVPCSFESPSLVPLPTSPVYTDDMLVPTARP